MSAKHERHSDLIKKVFNAMLSKEKAQCQPTPSLGSDKGRRSQY